jgi:ethanolaminephosphotransferase
VGNNALAYVMLMTIYACFHFCTLEEYYVGTLRLPVCNGVSDGSVMMIILFIVTGIFGNDVWAKGVADGKWLHIEGLDILTMG